jgi:hypothetical protein
MSHHELAGSQEYDVTHDVRELEVALRSGGDRLASAVRSTMELARSASSVMSARAAAFRPAPWSAARHQAQAGVGLLRITPAAPFTSCAIDAAASERRNARRVGSVACACCSAS